MVALLEFRSWALAFGGVEEVPHFNRPSFRFNRKIFAVLHEADNRAVLKLSPTDQNVFQSFDPTVFYPAQGQWGRQGYTFVELDLVRPDMLRDALSLAYDGVKRVKRS